MKLLRKLLLGGALTITMVAVGIFIYFYQYQPTNIDYEPGLTEKIAAAKFGLPPNLAANLFASEVDFDLGNVMAINFDSQGRLWAMTMPTYPHYNPGVPPNDKIIILEDTNLDGKADKQTIFADSLYLPTGFELGYGGVFVAEQSNILFLEDLDGDDQADSRRVLLQGFGTEDSHHAPSAFEWGPDGALYFHQGLFSHTQVETPYGVVRVKDGCTFRYHPTTELLEPYINYPYLNPWGQVFDQWGRHLVADASDGSNYFGNSMSGKVNFPNKHRGTTSFTQRRLRPTCGIELVSSRHFPDYLQGDMLVNNVLYTQGIWDYAIHEKSSGIEAEDKGIFLRGRDPNFRPVDLQFGPDGTLFVADWWNPIIGHMQHSIRDEKRDHSHGRIWRISNNEKSLLPIVNFKELSVPDLLEYLQAPELRNQYRCRQEVWQRDKEEVFAAFSEFQQKYPLDERLMVEHLWLHQAFDQSNIPLLKQVLSANNPRARAAGYKALRYYLDQIEEPMLWLEKGITDDSPMVRMEALVTLSFQESEEAAILALRALEKPGDTFLYYSLANTIRHLKSYFDTTFWQDSTFAIANQELVRYLYKDDDWELQTLWEMPKTPALLQELLLRDDITNELASQAIEELTRLNQNSRLVNLLDLVKRRIEISFDDNHPVMTALMDITPGDLKASRVDIKEFISSCHTDAQRQIGMACLIKGDCNLVAIEKYKTEWNIQSQDWAVVAEILSKEKNNIDWILKAKELLAMENQEDIMAGVKTLGYIPGKEIEKVSLLIPHLQNIDLMEASVFALGKTQLDRLPLEKQSSLAENLIALLKTLPENLVKTDLSIDMVNQLVKMQANLSAPIQQEIKNLKDQYERQEVLIYTLKHKMKYDRFSFEVVAGTKIKLSFINVDMMPHNLVITTPGSLEKVGKAADKLVSNDNGEEPNYVPDMEEVLFYTPIVQPQDQFDLIFTAPEIPGNYPFVCTYPGHWTIMNGIMEVVSKDIALQ